MSKNEQLMNTAISALAAGRKDTARRILTNVVTTDPCNQQAWLCLAASVPPNLAIPALQKVLVLNPQNKMALQSISRLRAQPDKELDLADVLVGENQAGEALLATFGQEPPTIYEPSWWREQAKFTTELNTGSVEEDATLQRLIARLVPRTNTELKINLANDDPTLSFSPIDIKKLNPDLPDNPIPALQGAEPSPKPEKPSQDSILFQPTTVMAAPIYPKTTHLMGARNEPYIKPISLEGISTAGTADFVSGNPTALKYMEFKRTIPARVKLKERPVRRNSGPKRTLIQLTNFGIIVITALLVIIIGYLVLMLIGI